MHDRKSWKWKISPCEDDILTPWKDPSDRLEGLATHDDRIPLRRLTEMSKIFRNMPWYLPLVPDDTVVSHGSDGDVVNFLCFCHCEERSNPCSERIRLYFFLFRMQKYSPASREAFFILYLLVSTPPWHFYPSRSDFWALRDLRIYSSLVSGKVVW